MCVHICMSHGVEGVGEEGNNGAGGGKGGVVSDREQKKQAS